ncbi:MAG TPA: hypothetical protein VNX29_05495 [Kaistia sp.]|nr:hypothetical protein [Kaistia sp.]
MAAALITKLIKDGIGGLLPRRLLDAAGDGTGPFVAITIPGKADGTGVVDIEALSAAEIAAINAVTATIDNGVPITAAALPLPTGAATATGVSAVKDAVDINTSQLHGDFGTVVTMLGNPLPLPTGAATDASLASILAKLPASPALDASIGGTSAAAAGDTGASTTNGFLRWLRDKFAAGITLAAGSAVIGKVVQQVASADVSATNPVPVGGAQLVTVAATIASGGSLSGAVDLGTGRLVGLIMPASWTTASISFQASADGANFYDLYDDSIERAIASGSAIASRFIALSLSDWLGVRAIKVRSGSTSAAVNQGASRIITLVTAR